jgi:long-chain acyl-CoA synthetase
MNSHTITLPHLLNEACKRHPKKVAVIDGEMKIDFLSLQAMADHLASAFVNAHLQGSRVATLLPNCLELIVCYLACWQAGVTMVPFEYVDAPPEIAAGIADSEPKWLIVHQDKLGDLAKMDLKNTSIEKSIVLGNAPKGYTTFSELLETPLQTLPDVESNTLAFILYTSGSTALPKGVTHSHASAGGIVASVLSALNTINSNSLMVIHDPISHMGGWIEAFPLLFAGATIVLDQDFNVDTFYSHLRNWKPTIIGAHVHHLWEMTQYPGVTRNDFASVTTAFTGGDELPIPLQRAFMKLTGIPIQSGWGMTEAIWLTIAREPNVQQRGFMGKPVEHVQLRLVDADGHDVSTSEIGEIWVKGPMVTPGYWNRPEINKAILKDGWLRTGDLGLKDSNGDYWFMGRVKQIIERNSENITPGEVEQALLRHPHIDEAVVVGIADPKEGQVPVAFVTFKSGKQTSESELQSFLATQIAEFKIPTRIIQISEMPLTPSGKIDRKALLGFLK